MSTAEILKREILDKTRELVIDTFERSDDEVKDGMDISLCALEGNKLQYAGAYNPLWIVRGEEILEFKGTKQPIGNIDKPTAFTTHNIELQQGDSIYLLGVIQHHWCRPSSAATPENQGPGVA